MVSEASGRRHRARRRIHEGLRRLARLRERRAVRVMEILLVVFFGLSLAVHSPQMTALDRRLTLAVQDLRCPPLDALAAGFTFFGDSVPLVTIGACCALLLWWLGRPHAAGLALAALLALPVNVLLKAWVNRPRPTSAVVQVLLPAIGLSFPSGHAMASAMFYCFLALLAWLHIVRPVARWSATVFLVLLAVGISASRIYLGAHWFSDVAGGWVAGTFFLLILAEVYRKVALSGHSEA